MVKHWLIIGASGGIGNALVQHLLAQGQQVSAVSRRPQKNTSHTENAQGLNWYQIAAPEHADAADILTHIFNSKVDAMVLCHGWLHGEGMLPEKSIRQLSRAMMQQSLEINLLQPALYLKLLLPLLQKQQNIKAAVLSAKVGSITDNQLGGWYSYRMAKAALNMLVKSSSIELARYNKEATLISLHPGTTDSELSAPFQKNLPEGQLRSAAETAERLIQVITELTPEQTGALVNWDGALLPY